MSWQVKQEAGVSVVILDRDMGIQNAADFHQAVVPLAALGAAVRVDARAARSVHSSIMRILSALSQAVPDFAVTEASEDFRAAETRVGLFLARSAATATAANPSGPA